MVSRAASWPRSARATDMGVTLFDPLGTLVRLDVDGRADALPRSPDAWRQVNRAKASRVLGLRLIQSQKAKVVTSATADRKLAASLS